MSSHDERPGAWRLSRLAALEAELLEHRLAAADSSSFAPDLASALSNLSVALGELGRREEALDAIQEAVEIRRGLVTAEGSALAPDLASALNNLSVALGELGRREEALDAIEEAAATYRDLATGSPAMFGDDLAASLNNLFVALSGLGRSEDALAVAEEAVAIRREIGADAQRHLLRSWTPQPCTTWGSRTLRQVVSPARSQPTKRACRRSAHSKTGLVRRRRSPTWEFCMPKLGVSMMRWRLTSTA